MKGRSGCKARQYGDQMSCECGLGWDTNDPDPPMCRKKVVAHQELAASRAILEQPAFLALKRDKLLSLQEMPLGWLPNFGVPAGMYTVNWPSLPDASYVVINALANGQGRGYQFFTAKGIELIHVRGQRIDPLIFSTDFTEAE